MKAGFPSDMAEAYCMTLGILPRMRLLACGWTNPGDKFRSPTDASWWQAPYGRSLYAPIRMWNKVVDAAMARFGPQQWNFNQKLADGDPGEISQSLLAVSEQLQEITAAKHDVCAPYLIPIRDGVHPQPNAGCLIRIGADKKKQERDKARDDSRFDTQVRIVIIAAVLFTAAYYYKHGRAPFGLSRG